MRTPKVPLCLHLLSIKTHAGTNMSILDNAIDAIEVGVRDFDEGTSPRMKSAIRNTYAGLLLLFKQKLHELSPPDSDEVLLKQKIQPSVSENGVSFKGKGKKTVDKQAIQERLESLGIDVDWKEVESIAKIRNEIEHYYTRERVEVIREALSKAFVIACDFTSRHLNQDLRTLLAEDAWELLIEINAVYEAEKQRCMESQVNFDSTCEFAMEHVDSFSCSECHSDLILFKENAGATCQSCGKQWGQYEVAAAVVGAQGDSDAYDHVKDGGDLTVVDCPNCGEFAFVVAEAICAHCEESCSVECDICGIDIPPEEIDGEGRCSRCEHMLSKDD